MIWYKQAPLKIPLSNLVKIIEFVYTSTKPTCSAAGKAVFTATVNDGSNSTDTHSYTLSKKDHDFGNWIATETDWNEDYTDFTAKRSCKNCTRTETYTGSKDVEITYPDNICVQDGDITYTAMIGGIGKVGEITVPTEALGHDWDEMTTTAATCTEAG